MIRIPTLTFIYDRKHKATAKCAAFVELRVTYASKQKYLSTGIKILPRHWDKKNNCVRGRSDGPQLNAILDDIRERCLDIIQKQGSKIDLDGIIRAMKDKRSGSFLDYVSDRLTKRNVRESTRGRYMVFLSALEEWQGITSFNDITKAKIREFDEWLHSPDRNKGKGYKQSTIYSYHKHMKEFLNDAVIDGYIEVNPYTQLRMKIDKGESDSIDYLDESQIKKIVSLKLEGEGLNHARDLFLFQCYTGLAYSDMMKFDISDYRNIGGKWYSADEQRLKTKTTYYLQLLTPAVEILKKYDYHLPNLDNSSYNKYLKIIGAMIGVPKLHTHMGRSSFATLMLSKGMRIEYLAKVLGHTSTNQTKRYATILGKDIRDELSDIDKKL